MVTAGRHRLELLRCPRQRDGRRSVMKPSVLAIGLDPVFAVLHLTFSERVSVGSRVHLVQLPQAERPESRRMGWDWFETATARWPLPQPLDGWSDSIRVISGKSRVRKAASQHP